jgi:HPt (histidine-containing phosphotransfer) domain-containing protein
MDELQRMYRDALRTRLAVLESARAELANGGDRVGERAGEEDALAASVRRLAHTLRGSGATYGFPEITRAAEAAEDAPAGQLVDRLDALLVVIRDTIGADR